MLCPTSRYVRFLRVVEKLVTFVSLIPFYLFLFLFFYSLRLSKGESVIIFMFYFFFLGFNFFVVVFINET